MVCVVLLSKLPEQMELDSLIDETAPNAKPTEVKLENDDKEVVKEKQEAVQKPPDTTEVKEPESDPKDSVQVPVVAAEEETSSKTPSKAETESPSKPLVENDSNESKQAISDDSKEDFSESSSRKRKIDSIDETASIPSDEVLRSLIVLTSSDQETEKGRFKNRNTQKARE